MGSTGGSPGALLPLQHWHSVPELGTAFFLSGLAHSPLDASSVVGSMWAAQGQASSGITDCAHQKALAQQVSGDLGEGPLCGLLCCLGHAQGRKDLSDLGGDCQ